MDGMDGMEGMATDKGNKYSQERTVSYLTLVVVNSDSLSPIQIELVILLWIEVSFSEYSFSPHAFVSPDNFHVRGLVHPDSPITPLDQDRAVHPLRVTAGSAKSP